jgi:lysophospholipase L1-like esterase
MRSLAQIALIFTGLVFTGLTGTTATVQAEFPVKDGDRVLFLGDSITEQYQYSTDLELYLTTRFPNWRLSFVNAGISGDRAVGGAGRFAGHVLAEQPTFITINFGMNDAGYGAFNPGLQKEFLDNTVKMLTAAKEKNVRVALLSPNAVDRRIQERFKLYLETQKEFYAPLKDLAAQHGARFVDQYATTRAAVEKMETDKAEKVVPYPDGFHTGSSGGLLMAHAILTGLEAPALVSEVSISIGADNAETKNCVVSSLTTRKQRVSFTREDKALPLPVQKDWVTLLPYVNDLKDLNQYTLTIRGLDEYDYDIRIDDQLVATRSAMDLYRGTNLGNLTEGPVHAQGQAVFNAINEKNQLLHRRFRDVVMFNIPAWLADIGTERKQQELEKRWAEISERQVKIYELAQPKPRNWVIEAKIPK